MTMNVAAVGKPANLARRQSPVFDADPRVRFAYLFGSVARGEHRADSDLDLTVSVRTRGTLIDDARLRGRLVALGFRPYHDAYLAAVRERARGGGNPGPMTCSTAWRRMRPDQRGAAAAQPARTPATSSSRNQPSPAEQRAERRDRTEALLPIGVTAPVPRRLPWSSTGVSRPPW